jgi:hypothetical protein
MGLHGFTSASYKYCLILPFISFKVTLVLYKGRKYGTRSDSKVCKLATMYLPWQQWTGTSVWFDDIGMSAFHSCVVVDLWQSLSGIDYCLNVFWCAVVRMLELELEQQTINFLLHLARVETKSENVSASLQG